MSETEATERQEQTHFFSRPLLFGDAQSRATWAVGPAETLLVFVHGFGGSALATWLQFPTLLMPQQCCRHVDLVFYGYDGLRMRAQNSAIQLRTFLETFLPDPAAHINKTLRGQANRRSFEYKRIVLVAHSLGAIVVRRALLDALAKNALWVQVCELVLYAPAHMGADVAALATGFLTGMNLPGIAGVSQIAQYVFQVLQDLLPGSQTLMLLEERTRIEIATRGPASYLVARKVLLADNDKVVSPNPFVDDPPAEPLLSGNHTSICKPASSTLREFTELASLLP